MISEIIFLTLNTLFINISENYIHELSHNHKYGGFLYKAHHKHHAIDYPPTKLMKIKDEMDTDTRKPYVIVIGTGYGIIYTILPLYYYLIFLTYTSIYLLIVNELHNHYHYIDSPLKKYKWFLRLRRLHHIHHIKTNKNYNLAFHITDKYRESYLNNCDSKYLNE